MNRGAPSEGRLPPDADILELLYADGSVGLAEMVQQVGDRTVCVRAVDDLRRRRMLEIYEQTGETLSPMPAWKWTALGSGRDPGLESSVVLHSTPAGNEEWGRLYERGG